MLVFLSDCKALVEKVSIPLVLPWMISAIVNDIRFLLGPLDASCLIVPRVDN